ncbi:MAG: hypothetical protein JWN08_2769 [Frankiales bacterium]|nr:hypothetical protein [Frankiales bacterium]
MSLFDDELVRSVRDGAAWEVHRAHRDPASGPALDEVGVLALSSFQLARTGEVVVAVRGITAYSDGLLLSVVVLFADEQKTEDLGWSMQEFGRSPGRFRFGCAFTDGRSATTGTRDAPAVSLPDLPALTLLGSHATALGWDGDYWLHPLPPLGSLVLGCRWPDRAIPETLVEIDSDPLVAAALTSGPVWRTS